MYTTIDFDKYRVPQDSLTGTEKTAAGISMMDGFKNAIIGGAAAKTVDAGWDLVDKAFLKRKFVPTPEQIHLNPELLRKAPKGMISEADQLAARKTLRNIGGTAAGMYAVNKLRDPAVRQAIKNNAMRAVGKNPHKKRDMALAAAGTVGAGAAAYGVANHIKQQKDAERFDQQYGYGDYYGRRKHASVEDAFQAGYEDAYAEFVKEAGALSNFAQGAKDFFMYPVRAGIQKAKFIANHPKTFWTNAQRHMRAAMRGPKVPPAMNNPMGAWNSMSNNAKWMTGTGVAALGAGAYHMGTANQRKVEIN